MAIFNWHRAVLIAAVVLWRSLDATAYDVPKAGFAPEFIGHADRQVAAARKALAADTNRVEAIWRLGRALFFRAEFATGQPREELAEEGIALCERGLALAPDSPELNYYLALNQGQLAREKLFGALGLVRRMREHLLRAAAAKPGLDYAGPDRCLALLHRDAPGWPVSVGNRKEAARHLAKAYSHDPAYPENVLVLLESWQKWGEGAGLGEKIRAGEAALKKAREEFTGDEWEPHHDNWRRRWSRIIKRAAELSRD